MIRLLFAFCDLVLQCEFRHQVVGRFDNTVQQPVKLFLVELLAGQVCGEAPPLSRELQRAVSPARFPIRAIIRGQEPVRAS